MSKFNPITGRAAGSRQLITLLFVLLGFTACTTTTLVQSWTDPDYKGPAFNKFLIIGLFSDDNNRRYFETEFSKHLAADGVQNVTSYKLIPNPEDHDEKKELEQLIKSTGADAVLVARFMGIDKKETYVPPRTETVPTMGYGYGLYGYYNYSYATTYRPGYTRKDDIATLDTSVFATSNSQQVWNGKTESANPKGDGKAIKEVAAAIIKELKKSGLLK